MAWFTRVAVAAVVLYIGFFAFKISSLLFPQAFLVLSATGSQAQQPLLRPAWPSGTLVEVETLLINTKTKQVYNGKVVPPRLSMAFDKSNAGKTAFSLSLRGLDTLVAPGLALRFSFRSPDHAVSSVQTTVPLVVFRSLPKEKRSRQKINLVKNVWPLNVWFPRNSSIFDGALERNVPAFVSHDVDATSKRAAFLIPRVSVQLVADWTIWPQPALPDHIKQHLQITRRSGGSGGGGSYLPLVNAVQMGVKQYELIQINQTSKNDFPDVPVEVETTSLGRWAFYALMEDSFRLHRTLGMIEDGDMDDVRSLLTETSPELLGLTMVISLIHLLFDALAFKSDIAFWRHIDDAQGISIESAALGLVGQLIVALYLQEQSASALVLFPSYIGLVISLWKLVKLVSMRRRRREVSAKGDETRGSSTDDTETERIALKYMAVVLAPLVVAYSFWTLVREDHWSWYSWGISSLASCVYAGGFALMTPQIFLNYRLKSVAHLDWSALWFRAFNTFIDDFFAYLIPMPGLARVAVLRDDLVFIIFLYQRWLYPARRDSNMEYAKSKDD